MMTTAAQRPVPGVEALDGGGVVLGAGLARTTLYIGGDVHGHDRARPDVPAP
jgi:hypothetical protein